MKMYHGVCSPSPSDWLFLFDRCGGAPERQLVFPPRQEETDTLHQGPAQRARERVRSQQVHHKGQEEKDFGRDQPVRATDYHLVPEQEGEGEKIRGQSEEQYSIACRSLLFGQFVTVEIINSEWKKVKKLEVGPLTDCNYRTFLTALIIYLSSVCLPLSVLSVPSSL